MSTTSSHLADHWFVVAEERELKTEPMGALVHGIPLVLYRSGGDIIAAEDRCPHRNAPLSAGFLDKAERLVCPYHGWTFDGTGRCVGAPGLADGSVPSAGLIRWQIQHRDGFLWVRHPRSTLPRNAYESAFPDKVNYQSFSIETGLDSTLADALENLLDGTHTPLVHAGLVRSQTSTQTFTATIRPSVDRVEIEYSGESKQAGIVSRWFEPSRHLSFGRFVPPCTAELEYRSLRRTELFVSAHFTPTEQGRVRVWATCWLAKGRVPFVIKKQIVRPIFRRILRQDREILRLQSHNLRRFGDARYSHWPADVMRPWIDAWYRDGQFPTQDPDQAVVHFRL